MAATSFAKGLSSGGDEDDLVAQQLGAASASQLTGVKEQYKDKVKAALAAKAAELAAEKAARAAEFEAGKAAYARGRYPQAVALLEQALNKEGPFTMLGGEVQLWLALAYQACGREEDCLEVYRAVEKSHPAPRVRRQAAELRYILEAPKLELSADEKVQIPVLDLDRNQARGGRQPAPRARVQPAVPRRPKTWDEEYWANYEPPKLLTNRYVWVATAMLVAALLAWSR